MCPAGAPEPDPKCLQQVVLEEVSPTLWRHRHGSRTARFPQNKKTWAVKVIAGWVALSMAAVSLWTPIRDPRIHSIVATP